ncbi:MAG TPA: ABC transporter permease [Blastocatellia bacterium]|nr:ABC transporter permease [Blastocatellia bacterium]
MESLRQDLAYGLRTLFKNPGFTIVAVLTIGLGTGANTAIFSVLNGILLRPLPFREPERLVMVWNNNTKSNQPQAALSVPDLRDYGENNVLEQMASFAFDDFNLTGGDQPERVQGTMVSANFFSTLGVGAVAGRVFLPEDGQPGADRVVVISDGLWKRRFAADPAVVNQTISLNGASFTVVGVAPADFQSPEKGDELWVPMSFEGSDRLRIPSISAPEDLERRTFRFLKSFARLKPGTPLEQAQAEMSTIANRLEQQYPDVNSGMGISLVPLHRQVVGDVKPALLLLLAAVGLVLLIACANVANLLLARAAARQKEIAIRVALGAGRSRLIRQLLTESVMLALLGGLLGLGIAWLGLRALVGINPPNIPRLEAIGIDTRVLVFTLFVSLLAGLVFGLVPAIQASRPDLNEALKEGARGSTGGIGRRRVRSILVVTEVALTQMLLIGAGLMLKSFYSLQQVNPGFSPENVLTMQVTLPPSKYTEDTQIAAFYEQALNRIKSLPGVQACGAATTLPLTANTIARRFTIDGRVPGSPNERLVAGYGAVSPDYFLAMGIRLVSGRGFTDQDREKSPQVIIINETMRRRFWPNEDPIGKRISITAESGISREIIGVVADVKSSSLDGESGLQFYEPYLQFPWNFMAIAVRTGTNPLGLAKPVRDEILAVDNTQPVYDVKTLAQIVEDSVSQPRLYMLLLAVFAVIALTLAAVGIYGVMNYSVNQRKHEIGIRMAIGAQRSDIMKLIVGQGMLLAIIGVAVGVAAAFFLGRFMEMLLFGVGGRDLTTFIGVPVVLVLVSLMANYVPARRATRVDPMIALRAE